MIGVIDMYMRVLYVVAFVICISSSEAKLTFSNIQGQRDFLDTLLAEVEKTDNAKKSEQKQNEKSDIDRYKKDINTLKETLGHIEDETEKQKANDKVLQELVDEFNKKMKELEKTYKFIMSKYKKPKTKDEYLGARSHEIFTIDSLDYEKKRRKMKDVQFRKLELLEISGDSKHESVAPLPSKEK